LRADLDVEGLPSDDIVNDCRVNVAVELMRVDVAVLVCVDGRTDGVSVIVGILEDEEVLEASLHLHGVEASILGYEREEGFVYRIVNVALCVGD